MSQKAGMSTKSLRRSDLCRECATIDWEAIFASPGENPTQILRQDKASYSQSVKNSRGEDAPVLESSCHLCRFFAELHQSQNIEDESSGIFAWSHGGPVTSIDGRFYQHRRVDFQPERPIATLRVLTCMLDNVAAEMTQRRIVHRSFDAALPRAWLTHCQGHHPECSPKRPVPQTNLIDCIERNIVPSSFAHDKRFIALSYVWGKAPSKQQQQTQPTSSSSAALGLPVPLPHTIADAMTVTQALGFRYLWVDQYCINQTDPADKARQISQMDLIYKCADLTIIAAAGDSHDYGLPGVGERPRSLPEPFILDDRFKFGVHPLRETTWRQSTWNSRAWTFQEGQLPRRRLLFAEEGMVFECAHPAGGVQVENHVSIDCAGDDAALVQQFEEQSSKSLIARMGIGSQLLSLDLDTSNNDLTCLGEKLVSCFVQYLDLLKEYCKRELSFPSDGLHAFQGVANVFEKAPLPVYNVAGIPFIVAGETGSQLQVSSAEASFAYGLAWTTWTSRQPSAQDGSFPSWTWASMFPLDMQRPFLETSAQGGVSYRRHAHDIQFEPASVNNNDDGIKERLFNLLDYTNACTTSLGSLTALGPPRAVHLVAPILSPKISLNEVAVPKEAGISTSRMLGTLFFDRERKALGVEMLDEHGTLTLYRTSSQRVSYDQDQYHRAHVNLSSKRWGLLVLGQPGEDSWETRTRAKQLHILCIQWMDEQTAIRVGSIRLDLSLSDKDGKSLGGPDPFERHPDYFKERRVRLV